MQDLIKLQKEFDAEIDTSKCAFELFKHLEDVAFFMKNHQYQLIRANRTFYSRLGLETELELLGKDDFELFPKPLAKKFRQDDELVMKSQKSIHGTVELFLNRQGLPDWYITNKIPVLNRQGKSIGVMGTVQKLDQNKNFETDDPVVSQVIQSIVRDPGQKINFTSVAKHHKISHRQLDRRFKDVTGLTPQQFLNKKRIEVACQHLRQKRTPILDIALDLGYCDQSAFTAQFRNCMGMTPLKYRLEFKR